MKKLLGKLIPKLYGLYFNILAFFNTKKAVLKVFYLFCTPRKGRVKPTQKNFLDSAKAKMHSFAEHSIQTYHWPGSKETVLLLHGWESNTHRWFKLIEKLKKADFNIIAFDAPGHGNSSGKYLYVPLYADVLEHMLQIYLPKHLIGHSLGGMTAMFHQYHQPNSDIEKIVTIGSPSEFFEIMDNYQQILGFNSKIRTAVDNYIKERFGFYINELSTSKYAKTNTKKGLLFHDKLDRIAPYYCSEQVHASWKGSKLVSTEGLGHSMHKDEIGNQIVEFLASSN